MCPHSRTSLQPQNLRQLRTSCGRMAVTSRCRGSSIRHKASLLHSHSQTIPCALCSSRKCSSTLSSAAVCCSCSTCAAGMMWQSMVADSRIPTCPCTSSRAMLFTWHDVLSALQRLCTASWQGQAGEDTAGSRLTERLSSSSGGTSAAYAMVCPEGALIHQHKTV